MWVELDEVLKLAMDKSECVSLFIIVMFLLICMHASNLRKLDILSRDIRHQAKDGTKKQ